MLIRLSLLAAMILAGPEALAETINFDDMPAEQAPAGFTVALTGGGKAPVWLVRPAPEGAPGKSVVQTSAEAIDNRFPILIRDGVPAADRTLSVTFRAVSGRIDQAAGLVWRYRDADNYYLVRANALEDNVVTYKVENGQRVDLPVKGQGQTYGAQAPVNKGGWNTLAVTVSGDTFAILLNGKPLYEVEDRTFPVAGRLGLWTKPDSVIMFDDLTWTIIK